MTPARHHQTSNYYSGCLPRTYATEKNSRHKNAIIESAIAEQRPTAMIALDAAQIGRDLGLEHGIDRLAKIMAQQHVFRRYGRVRFELEDPMSVALLQCEQRRRGCLYAAIKACCGRRNLLQRHAIPHPPITSDE